MPWLPRLIDFENPALEFLVAGLLNDIYDFCSKAVWLSMAEYCLPRLTRSVLPSMLGPYSGYCFFVVDMVSGVLPYHPLSRAAILNWDNLFEGRRKRFVPTWVQKLVAVGAVLGTSWATRSSLRAFDVPPAVCLIGIVRWLASLQVIDSRLMFNYRLMNYLSRYVIIPQRQKIRSQRAHSCRYMIGSVEEGIPPFNYQPLLWGQEIRLLKMQVLPGEPSVTTSEIVQTDLSFAPPYAAISYVWGDAATVHPLFIGSDFERCLLVTASTHRVLKAVAPLEGIRYVWVDSICINQSDRFEKDQQIAMMSQIYGNAEEVVVVLGDSPEADIAVSYINRACFDIIMREPQFHLYENIDCVADAITVNVDDLAKAYKNPPAPDLGFVAFVELFKNRYWSRGWIVQECIAAKKILVVYGNGFFNANMLYMILTRMSLNKETILQSEAPFPQYVAQHVLDITKARIQYQNREVNGKPPLAQLISDFAMAQTSEPVDQVYAFLSVSSDNEASCLLPDHHKCPRIVYTDLVKHTLNSGSFLTFSLAGLARSRTETKIPGLPSWVPDLTCSHMAWMRHGSYREYEGARSQQCQYEIINGGYILKLRAVLLDKIQTCSSDPSLDSQGTICFSNDEAEIQMNLFGVGRVAEMHQMIMQHPQTRQIYKDVNDALVRTLIEDFDSERHPAQIDFTKAVYFLRKVIEFHESSGMSSADRKLGDPKLAVSKVLQLHASPSKWHIGKLLMQITWITLRLKRRSFAVTEKGYMALVPPGTKSGDVLSFPLGSPLAHVLRPAPSNGDKNYYLFWGEAYVHGLMGGQALNSRDPEWLMLQ